MVNRLGAIVARESTFTERMTKARVRKGWTQQELADRLGITRSSVANIEGGRSLPRLDGFEDLCRALGVRPDYLLGFSSRP